MADRILTTHVGSLPRPKGVSDMLFAREAGEAVDPHAFDTAVAEARERIRTMACWSTTGSRKCQRNRW